MDINSFILGMVKGRASVPAPDTQEKTVTVTENGTTEVLPDEGKLLSKVTVETNVAGGGGGGSGFKFVSKYVTLAGTWKERVNCDFGFTPGVLILVPSTSKSVSKNVLAVAVTTSFSEKFSAITGVPSPSRNEGYYAGSSSFSSSVSGSDPTQTNEQATIYDLDETGFNVGKTFAQGGYRVYAIGE